jgi:hypothetical protein
MLLEFRVNAQTEDSSGEQVQALFSLFDTEFVSSR